MPGIAHLRELAYTDIEHFAGSFWDEGAFDLADEWRERVAILMADGVGRVVAEIDTYKMITRR